MKIIFPIPMMGMAIAMDLRRDFQYSIQKVLIPKSFIMLVCIPKALGRSVSNENIYSKRNLCPVLNEFNPSRFLECPSMKLGLYGTSPKLDAFQLYPTVMQINKAWIATK